MNAKSNPIVIRPDTKIGNIAAENDDEFLFNCFVDHPALASVLDTTSPQMLVSGRTGSGKTAIIRMVEHQKDHVDKIDLHELALNYIANSDIIRFLNALDIDLDLFFQALWKHVLGIEFIRMRFSVKNADDSRGIFSRIREAFSKNDRKNSAIKYLENWEDKFWITMDTNIREITSKLESQIGASLGLEVEKFKANAGYSRTLSAEKRAEVTSRAKKIVNADQLTELSKVLDLLAEYDQGDKFRQFYILIDRLDEKWVDESIRFSLIRALIECLKSFRKIPSLKIAVAMRADVLERVIQESKDLGFQREKYDDYFLRIVWKKDQLKQLVEKRVNFLYRRKYTSENIHFGDVFSTNVGRREPFDYMVERTLYRPRDIISFVNLCLTQAQGNSQVTARDIRAAEGEYSRIRLQALEEEWRSALPSLAVAVRKFAKHGVRFTLGSVSTKDFVEDLVIDIAGIECPPCDLIANECAAYLKNQTIPHLLRIAKMVTCELYRIGAIGIKTGAQERFIYAYQDTPVVSVEMVDTDTRIHIHPMLHRALNLAEQKV